MNIQTATTHTGPIAASVASGKVYVKFGWDVCMFLTADEAIDLIAALTAVVAELES